MTTVIDIAAPTGSDMSRAPVATPAEARASFHLLPMGNGGLTSEDVASWVKQAGGRFASSDELRSGSWV